MTLSPQPTGITARNPRTRYSGTPRSPRKITDAWLTTCINYGVELATITLIAGRRVSGNLLPPVPEANFEKLHVLYLATKAFAKIDVKLPAKILTRRTYLVRVLAAAQSQTETDAVRHQLRLMCDRYRAESHD